MGSRVRLLLATVGTFAMFAPMQETISAQSGTGIVISEFRVTGPRGTNDEFVELFNASPNPITITNWTLRAANNTDMGGGVSPTFLRATITTATTIQPGCYFLITNPILSNGPYSAGPPGDQLYNASPLAGIADNGGLAIVRADGTIADQVGFVGFSAYYEGTKLAVPPPVVGALPPPNAPNRGFSRKPHPQFGYLDTNNNVNDFELVSPPQPQNSQTPCVPFAKFPHEVQGAGATSPLTLGTPVNVRGVVTAKTANGFFLQTEPVNEDGNPATSEGLFVSHAGAVPLGHLVVVTGQVAEHTPPADPGSPSRTGLNSVTNVLDLGAASVPVAHTLTPSDLSPSGSLDQLERFEGMLVRADALTAVSGSDHDAAFFTVLLGQPRPFREPGAHVGAPSLACALAPCNVAVFDGNPELLRVDADGLDGVAAVAVSTGATLPNVTGVLDFAARAYTLVPASPLAPVGGMFIVATAGAAADQFTVASLNLGSAYPARTAKASLTIRTVLQFPDVIAVQGVETVGDLLSLAAQVNADAAGAVEYDALPSGGNPSDALGVGVLVRHDRVGAASVEPLSSTAFDQSPLVLRATVAAPPTRLPQTLTVVVTRFAPSADVERNDATGAAARAKRQAQAEFLADYIQGQQINDPSAAILSIGGYDAFDFNDGYVDVVGTVSGVPAGADQLTNASADVVSPDLMNLDDASPAAERYTTVANGNAQPLDHVLASANLSSQFAGLLHARVNADFPLAFRNDAASPVRVSDADPLVAYFTFLPDLDPPVFAFTPTDHVVEATGPGGAAVAYPEPTADDNLDASVVVTCSPASGSPFPLGHTGVTCSTQDLAGNANSVSFTVTVQDTTAPSLTVPADLTVEAASAAGAVVSFATSASDAVSASLGVNCLPASGSTFALGTTDVNCSVEDAAGNHASAVFLVSVVDTMAPSLVVPSPITAEATSSAGSSITFAAWATDAVAAAPVVTCLPASGSTFPVGETTVSCDATDGAGNASHGSFTVTITQQTTSASGRLTGAGEVAGGGQRTWFALDVRQGDNAAERGRVMLLRRAGNGRPDRFLSASVFDVVVGAGSVTFKATGSWNGQSGYRVEITAADHGEPGRGTDTFAVKVFAPNGTLVASASGVLDNGNLEFRGHQTSRAAAAAAALAQLLRPPQAKPRKP